MMISDPTDDLFDDDFLMEDEDDDTGNHEPAQPWRILIVDDEPGVHQVTKLALSGVTFDGTPLSFDSAHSAEEAMARIDGEEEYAVILLDVVMESDDAGLTFARWLRKERDIIHPRIILRTGQPGQAPEREVVVNYDINDYKAKADLTADRLFISIVTALRSYSEMKRVEAIEQEMRLLATQGSLLEHEVLMLLPVPVICLDGAGQVTVANQAAATLLGTADPSALFGTLAETSLPDALSDVAEAPGVHDVEIKGDLFRCRVDAVSVGEQSGHVICLLPARPEGPDGGRS